VPVEYDGFCTTDKYSLTVSSLSTSSRRYPVVPLTSARYHVYPPDCTVSISLTIVFLASVAFAEPPGELRKFTPPAVVTPNPLNEFT